MSTLDELAKNVISGNAEGAKAMVNQALSEGLPAQEILNQGLIAAMSEVGRLFEIGEFYVPEMLIAARAMKAGLALLRPKLAAEDVKPVGKVVIGTVQGDLHDIGKNLVSMMLEGAGFEVIDLGTDVPPHKFVEAVRQHKPDYIGLSALLTTTMPKMKTTIQALVDEGLRGDVKVMIGGAPVTDKYAADIGADLYAPDASSAASRARSFIH
jgi:5-methyltetrahydrofolate--homocysteine methyltransferase